MKWVEGWRRGAAGTVSGTRPGTPTGAHAPTIPSDDSLLALIGAGDSGALATVFDRHGGAVYALAVVLAGSPQGAEMVVQGVFVRLWHVASGCGGGQVPLRPWLAAATLRRAGRVPPHRRPQPDPDPDGQFAGPEAGPEAVPLSAQLRSSPLRAATCARMTSPRGWGLTGRLSSASSGMASTPWRYLPAPPQTGPGRRSRRMAPPHPLGRLRKGRPSADLLGYGAELRIEALRRSLSIARRTASMATPGAAAGNRRPSRASVRFSSHHL